MNYKKTLVILLLTVMLLTFTFPAYVFASGNIDITDKDGDGHWKGNAWHLNLYPGEIAEAEITFKNRGSETVEIELDAYYLSSNVDDNIKYWWDDRRFDLRSGRSKEKTLYVEVNGDAVPNEYELEFTVDWQEYRSKEYVPLSKTKCPMVKASTTTTKYVEVPSETIIYQYQPYPIYYPPTVVSSDDGWVNLLLWMSIILIGSVSIGGLIYLVKRRKGIKEII